MTAIDDIKIKVDNVKTTLDTNVSKLEAVHSELDSINNIKSTKKTEDISVPGKNTIPEKEHHTDTKTAEDKTVLSKEEKEKKKHKFSSEERENFIKKYLAKRLSKERLRRKEKKMIKNAEYDATSGKVKEMTISLAVVGIILVVVLRNYLPNDAMFALLIIIGATTFMPIGMIMGWLMFDPVMRCKVLRKVSRRNYGVIQFVGHGGKMFPKIKNFDDSLIWRNNECWVLAESRVYQATKDGNAINKGKEIDSENIVTYVDTVPVLFLDAHSMAPMKLTNEGDSSVYPIEIGSQLKAWVDNQRAKMMAIKKMEDMMTIILVGASVCAAVLCLITMTKVDEMATSISHLEEQLQLVIEGLRQNPS